MHGGMATVYKAYQPSLNRYVALKLLSPTLSGDPTFLQRFQAEARSTARLEHPNIVPIYDMGQANGGIFIVMRFIDGGTLQQLLDRERRLPLRRALHITAQVAGALDYAHTQGFVHRDVKPANIMIEPGDRATLTDFGVAKALGETRLTRTGSIVGTPEYLSPEQARGDEIDGRADLYALGIVVYEMLAGRTPFQADNPLSVVHHHLVTPPPPPTQFNPAIPTGVAAVLIKVLAKDPAQRYPSADAFVQALRHAAGGLA
jgi:serine/threonine-protein kinase